jgi:hypothetical protein
VRLVSREQLYRLEHLRSFRWNSTVSAVKFDFVVNLITASVLDLSLPSVSWCASPAIFSDGGKGRDVGMIVKAKGPSGPAKVHSDDPKHALGLVQYLRTIGYSAWIEDTNGNEIEETVLRNTINEMHHE